ncbi:hypothetical protein AXG93_4666s1240 [Marchantia polymorpha subsp. ruderalis]|uniref:Glutamine-dependent NAD(+) synthetase n=1 Tax=Marchantia polymorpha subsp. ruderalis TaxID=1480154 RepID=A0A176W3C8_MARPO|nr:hypothetical protein AXG93_4666s1240 [Marchantia polymorpha subsp. ruderalis]
MRLVKVATCNLNQWAMDFTGNLARIRSSIEKAREAGAVLRVGPELEICGYGCEDHFLELDTCTHSWECLGEILKSGLTDGIVCDIGLPVVQGGVRYNCRAFCLDGQLLLIRPKVNLANDGNYRELRWFSAWKNPGQLVTYHLPEIISAIHGQKTVKFGDGYLQFDDTSVASETCEELFTPISPHINLALNGVEIIANGSGSHHQLRKLNTRLELMQHATSKVGGVYLYANQQGCDGGRLYYDGCASVVVNGDVVAQGSQFSLQDVEVLIASVDLDTVVSYRGAGSSLREQASALLPKLPYVKVDFKLSKSSNMLSEFATLPVEVRYHNPPEEIALGPACWLWDYLRRSGATGYLLPLSGGADSSSVAAIVGSMCQLVIKAIQEGNQQVLSDALRIGQYKDDEMPESAQEFAGRLLHTMYMGSENSSDETRKRAEQLAREVGSSHLNIKIDLVVSALLTLFSTVTGCMPRYKYDCSSADINPIGGISKQDLRSFLRWGANNLGYPSLLLVETAVPTAELEPITADYTQSDEADMGMTYEELGMYGRLRKVFECGPVSMFKHLCHRWQGRHTPAEVAVKVKDFFRFYSMNRHKMTTLTPSYHAENYSPEDNRFDLRQFLYNTRWPWQFKKIDELVEINDEVTSADQSKREPTEAEAAGRMATGLGVPAAAAGNSSVGQGT